MVNIIIQKAALKKIQSNDGFFKLQRLKYVNRWEIGTLKINHEIEI